ncbi:3-deoxy-7-phosphoheptulonate synthase [Candidatus Vidania fulgoroideorum]
MKIINRKSLYSKYYSKINKKNIQNSRKIINKIILGKCKKFIVIFGPCSIHSISEAKKFFLSVKKFSKNYKNIFFVARVYLEKPRTITGWKGMLYDPLLNESYKTNLGILKSLSILKFVSNINFPIATEFLNNIIVDYIKKFISIGTIGARNYESQIHREFCSDLDVPLGVKNGTSGDIIGAINSIISISKKHNYLKLDKNGKVKSTLSRGNNRGFLILRGGKKTNYKKKKINKYLKTLNNNLIKTGILIDCSHGNSKKKYSNQFKVVKNVCKQVKENRKIVGILLEVNTKSGNQEIKNKLLKGVSVTDECISVKGFKKCLKVINEIF